MARAAPSWWEEWPCAGEKNKINVKFTKILVLALAHIFEVPHAFSTPVARPLCADEDGLGHTCCRTHNFHTLKRERERESDVVFNSIVLTCSLATG